MHHGLQLVRFSDSINVFLRFTIGMVGRKEDDKSDMTNSEGRALETCTDGIR